MYKIEIINEVNGRSFEGFFKDKDEKNAWIDKQIAKGSWGKPERQIPEEEMPEELRSRVISTEVIPQVGDPGTPALFDADGNEVVAAVPASADYEPERTVHTVKPDYVVTETNLNLSKTYRNSKKLEARRAEYPSLEAVLHIILDHGLDSQEFADLQAERAAIKAKYPLEP